MTNEPKLAPEAPVKDAADGAKTEAKPIQTPAPATTTAPPADAKKV